MKVYTIFDDFPSNAIKIFNAAGIAIVVHPLGKPRPSRDEMKHILRQYDGVIVGTSQKITEDMFDEITEKRIIGTASVGIDHIIVPQDKRHLVTILNTPHANAQSVAEYTIGVALTAHKRIIEGCALYCSGSDNKALSSRPEEMFGKTFGVVGAGNISVKVIEYAAFFGLKVLCWTRNPTKHKNLKGVRFVSLGELVTTSDIISVNLPSNDGTKGIISKTLIDMMKDTAVFISVSRLETVDADALLEKAKRVKTFYVCIDIDIEQNVVNNFFCEPNIIITPHIAGGTTATRKRMFLEVAEKMSSLFIQYN